MNLYTLPENQKLIWSTIMKVPNFQHMVKNDPNESEHWFRDIIQMYYTKNKGNIIDKTALRVLNKETIGYMLSSLKQKDPPQPVSFDNGSAPFQNNFSSLQTNTNETRGYLLEQKQEQLNNQFQTRQNDYSSLFDKPKVQEIDFREKAEEEDKPIENMEELMKRQMAEREYDVQNIAKQLEESKESKEAEKQEKIAKVADNIQKIETNNDIMEEMREKIEDLQTQINELKAEQEKMKIDHINKNTDEIISKLRNIDNTKKTHEIIRESASR